jgi:hypothetical protein
MTHAACILCPPERARALCCVVWWGRALLCRVKPDVRYHVIYIADERSYRMIYMLPVRPFSSGKDRHG